MIYTDLHYFGCISYYAALAQHELVMFDTVAAFSKMSFKNRMVIASAQGPLHLSIPIVGGRDQKTPMSEIQISKDHKWQSQHFKSIYSSYKRAPYFDYYVDSLKVLYDKEYVQLNDFLMATQIWLKQQLKANWTIENSRTDALAIVQEKKWIDAYKPNNFNAISHPLVYQQVFETSIGFIPNTCALDLLFAMGGKQAMHLLRSSKD